MPGTMLQEPIFEPLKFIKKKPLWIPCPLTGINNSDGDMVWGEDVKDRGKRTVL